MRWFGRWGRCWGCRSSGWGFAEFKTGRMMPHGERLAELHRKAQRVATAYFLRYGRIPVEVKEVLAATESLEGLRKYDPDQLRVPAGRPGGGRWTDGGDWFDPAHPPGYVDFLAPDDKPLEQVYIVEAVALLAVWEAVAAARIVAGLAAPVLARVASARRINQAAKAIEEYLGGSRIRFSGIQQKIW